MDKKDDLQWDVLVDEAFGTSKTPVQITEPAAAEPELPEIQEPEVSEQEAEVSVAENTVPPAPKRPFYRKAVLWLSIALVLVTGLSAWLLAEKLQSQTPEDPTTQELLGLCKEGITKWQSAENYHLTQYLERYGGTSYSHNNRIEYFRRGEDFLSVAYVSYSHGDYANGEANVNGYSYMAKTSKGKNNENVLSQDWYMTEKTVKANTTMWPHWFNWDDNEIKLSYAAYDEESGGEIALLMIPQSIEGQIDSPYQVIFRFGKGGQSLWDVTVITTDPAVRGTSTVSVMTYEMTIAEPAVILSSIHNWLSTPIPLLEDDGGLWW